MRYKNIKPQTQYSTYIILFSNIQFLFIINFKPSHTLNTAMFRNTLFLKLFCQSKLSPVTLFRTFADDVLKGVPEIQALQKQLTYVNDLSLHERGNFFYSCIIETLPKSQNLYQFLSKNAYLQNYPHMVIKINSTLLSNLKNNTQQQQRVLNQSKKALQSIANPFLKSQSQAIIQNNLGDIAFYKGQVTEAFKHYNRCFYIQIRVLEELKQQLNFMKTQNDLGKSGLLSRTKEVLKTASTILLFSKQKDEDQKKVQKILNTVAEVIQQDPSLVQMVVKTPLYFHYKTSALSYLYNKKPKQQMMQLIETIRKQTLGYFDNSRKTLQGLFMVCEAYTMTAFYQMKLNQQTGDNQNKVIQALEFITDQIQDQTIRKLTKIGLRNKIIQKINQF